MALTKVSQGIVESSGRKNHVINGNFDLWQRGTSQSGNGYGSCDRFRSSTSGSSVTTSQQSFTLGQTNVPNNPTYYCRSAVTSSAGAGNYAVLQHRIEDVTTLAGKTVTLSFWAKANTSIDMAVEFVQLFGTGGSPSGTVSGIGVNTISLTTLWQKFEITVSLPSISGKVLGTNNDDWLGVFFWFDAGSDFNSRTNTLGQQSGTFDIAQIQLEEGSTATNFEFRNMAEELAMCQRYYEKSTNVNTAMFSFNASSGFTYYGSILFNTTKRASPSVTLSNHSTSNFNNATVATTVEEGFRIDGVATGNDANGYFRFIWEADAEL